MNKFDSGTEEEFDFGKVKLKFYQVQSRNFSQVQHITVETEIKYKVTRCNGQTIKSGTKLRAPMVKPSNQVHSVIQVQQQILVTNSGKIASLGEDHHQVHNGNLNKLIESLQSIHKTVLGSKQCREQN